MIVHFAAAAHHITETRNIETIAGSSRYGILFENMNMIAWHLAVTHQVTGRRQGRQTGADDICMLAVYAGWLLRTGKRLIVAAAVVHVPPPWG